MTLRLKNKNEISRYLVDYGRRIEKALIYQLEYAVADLQNHAKLSAGYQDQTSNLKTSIGGVVLKNGQPIRYTGFSGAGNKGETVGNSFIDSLIPQFSNGYVMILVAGMEYASAVENHHGLNVLSRSELKMMKDLPMMLQTLKDKIK